MRKFKVAALLATGIAVGLAAGRWLLAFRRPQDGEATPATPTDDLLAIRGVGPVYRDRLLAAGIASFAELLEAGPGRVAEITQVYETAAADWLAQAAALSGSR